MKRWRWFFRRKQLEAQLEAELRDHIEHQVHEYEQQGLDRAEAYRRAMADLGGLDPTKE